MSLKFSCAVKECIETHGCLDNIQTDIAERVQRRCQKKFDEWLANQPVVYGTPDLDLGWTNEVYGQRHKARLVNIEEIGKKT